MPGMDSRAPERTERAAGSWGRRTSCRAIFFHQLTTPGLHLRLRVLGVGALVVVVVGADLGGDGEARGHRQADATSRPVVIDFSAVSSEVEETQSKPLKLVNCFKCGANVFISGELQPLETTGCSKCDARTDDADDARAFRFEGQGCRRWMGTVYKASDTVLQRDVGHQVDATGIGRG